MQMSAARVIGCLPTQPDHLQPHSVHRLAASQLGHLPLLPPVVCARATSSIRRRSRRNFATRSSTRPQGDAGWAMLLTLFHQNPLSATRTHFVAGKERLVKRGPRGKIAGLRSVFLALVFNADATRAILRPLCWPRKTAQRARQSNASKRLPRAGFRAVTCASRFYI